MSDVDASVIKNRRLARDLKDAAREGDFEKIKNLINAGADANGFGSIGQPPLTSLVFRFFGDALSLEDSNQSLKSIEFLLNSGADPNAGDPSSFELSVELGDRRIIALMLKHGADLNKKTNSNGGMFPLHLALSCEDEGRASGSGCAIDFINAGAQLSVADELGNLPIHLASKNGHIDALMEILKRRLEDINKENGDGCTPIFLAANNGQEDSVKILLNFGAESFEGINEILSIAQKNRGELKKSALQKLPEVLDLGADDEAYLSWARDIGFDQDVQQPNLEPENDDDYVPSLRNQIDNWFDETYVPVIDALWKKYVPKTGACTVLQGELSRCIGRLEGELFRNGMMNMGDGFYDRMVDKIKETVLKDDRFTPLVQKVMEMDALVVKGADYSEIVNTFSFFHPTDVEVSLNRMKMVVAAWCIANPEPIEFTPSVLD